jgi:hypothetical protein
MQGGSMPKWHHPPDVIDLGGAAGTAGLAHDFPLSTIVELHSLAFVVACAGGGAARQVVVELQDGRGTTVYGIAAPGTQASGQTVTYSFAPLVSAFGSGSLGFMGGPLPGGRLPFNMSLAVTLVGAGASDTITDATLLVRQYPTRPDYS